MKKWLWRGAVAVFCASSLFAVDWKALKPQGCVSDYAGVIDAKTKSELEAYCGQVERSTGVRTSLVTIESLEGEPLADVARSIFRAWGPDAASITAPATSQKDERVMVLVTITDRHDWVETGSSLPPSMTEGLRDRILRETRFALRKKEYGEAFRAAAETIGASAAQARHASVGASLPRRMRWSLAEAIPWVAIAGAVLITICLVVTGNPAGYGGLASRGFLPGLFRKSPMRRSTWGSRGTGGFGGYDSGDASGGFGGGCCTDW
jgi:uncharacterized protein